MTIMYISSIKPLPLTNFDSQTNNWKKQIPLNKKH